MDNTERKTILNKWFWSWLGLSIILVAVMVLIPMSKSSLKLICSIIIATMMLLPIRNWLERFLAWALEYAASRSTSFRNKINRYATYNRLIDSSKRVWNTGFYRVLHFMTNLCSIFLAIASLVFQETSYQIVFAFLNTCEYIIRGWIPLVNLLIYILITVAFFFLIYQEFKWLSTQKMSAGKWILLVMSFYGKIFISGLLLHYTTSMIWASIRFWTTIVGVPLLIFVIWNYSPISKTNSTPPTSDPTDSEEDKDEDKDKDEDEDKDEEGDDYPFYS